MIIKESDAKRRRSQARGFSCIALALMFIMAGLLLTELLHAGVTVMPPDNAIVLSLHTLEIVLLSMMLFSSIQIGSFHRDRMSFIALTFALALELFLDAAGWVMDGLPGCARLYTLTTTATFMLDPVISWLVWHFLCLTYDIQTPRKHAGDRIALVAMAFGVVFAALSPFTGSLFVIHPDGVYETGPCYLLSALPTAVITLLSYIAIFRVKARMREKLILLSYLTVPLLIQIFTSDIEASFLLSYTFSFVVHFFAYSNLLVLRERESMKQRATLAAARSELEIATRIQTSMLPVNFDDYSALNVDIYAGMTPAREVGGDFYDFFAIDERHICVLIADVTGKSVPAAMFMTIGKTLVHRALKTAATPAEAVASAHAALCEDNEANLFITLWVGVIDLENDTLTYTNAGHNPPLIRYADGSYDFLKDRHGVVLGCCLVPDACYRQSVIPFPPGTKLFLYTDGVTEAHDVNEQMYGDDRLHSVLNRHGDEGVRDIIHSVAEELRAFSQGAPQFDDITMLAFERRPDAD